MKHALAIAALALVVAVNGAVSASASNLAKDLFSGAEITAKNVNWAEVDSTAKNINWADVDGTAKNSPFFDQIDRDMKRSPIDEK